MLGRGFADQCSDLQDCEICIKIWGSPEESGTFGKHAHTRHHTQNTRQSIQQHTLPPKMICSKKDTYHLQHKDYSRKLHTSHPHSTTAHRKQHKAAHSIPCTLETAQSGTLHSHHSSDNILYQAQWTQNVAASIKLGNFTRCTTTHTIPSRVKIEHTAVPIIPITVNSAAHVI